MKRVAFQGELGAYSELATYEFFGKNVTVIPKPTFAEVFNSVTDGDADHGIIPIENSLAGSIHENYDLLLDRDLVITGEIKLRIVHNLIVNAGTKLTDIKRVYSHPQALSQCKDYLQTLGNIEQISVYDTAAAAKMLAEQVPKSSAVIASSLAADIYHLEIIKEDIDDFERNRVRYLVLSKDENKEQGNKCSILFSTEHRAGTLFSVLEIFAKNDVNLTRIGSIPSGRGDYAFFLDFMGSDKDEKIIDILKEVKTVTTELRLIGCYNEKIIE